jgi:hypothetical protein
MKKVMFAASIIMLASCKKEEICNCGLIKSDNAANYSVVIENDCSGNNKEFVLAEGDWMNAHPGETYCISNVDSW